MAEIPLYKDEKYVELVGKILTRLKEGFENKASYTRLSKGTGLDKIIELDANLYNRAVNAILAQPNRAFQGIMEEFQDLDITQLAKKIKNAEDKLLRKFQLVEGMEAHHILPQNVMTWLSELSPKKALHALHLYRKQGGTTGVVPENVRLGSQLAHRAGKTVRLLADTANEGVKNFISAHVDPLSDTLADNTKFFMEGFDRNVKGVFKQAQRFTEKDSLKFIVQTIKDQAGNPSRLFAKALDQPIETKAKEWIAYLTGRDDLFKLAESGADSTLIRKYNKALSLLNINFNEIVKAAARGDKLPEVSEDIRNVFKSFSESAASKIDKTWSESKLLTKLKVNLPDTMLSNPFVGKTIKGKVVRPLVGAIPFIGLPVDAAHAYGSTSLAFREPSIDNTLRAGSSWINFFDQTGLFDFAVHYMTDPKRADEKGRVNLTNALLEGSMLTSIPSDNSFASYMNKRQQNMTAPGTVEVEEENDEGDTITKTYQSIQLPLIDTGVGVKW